jgi:hypothetical protein
VTPKTRLFLAILGTITAAVVAYDVLRPASGPARATYPISTPAAPELRRGLNKTPLLYPAEFSAQLASEVAQAFLQVEAVFAGGSEILRGVAVSEHSVVVAPSRVPESWRVTHQDGHTHDVTRAAIDALHGIVLLTLGRGVVDPLTLPSTDISLDEPVVAMTVGAEVEAPFPAILDPPFTFDQLEARLSSRLNPGAVVVNLDSMLLAFGASAPGSARPIVAPRLSQIVAALERTGRHRHPWTGVEVQAIEGPLRSRFPKGALVVVHVDPSSSVPEQLDAGTVLLEVRAGDERATTEPGVERAIASFPSVAYVRLDGRTFETTVEDLQTPAGFGSVGMVAGRDQESRLTVAPMSRAASLGFQTGDVVREIDLRPVRSVVQVEDALRGPRERLFTVQRGDRWRFVLWTPKPVERRR